MAGSVVLLSIGSGNQGHAPIDDGMNPEDEDGDGREFSGVAAQPAPGELGRQTEGHEGQQVS